MSYDLMMWKLRDGVTLEEINARLLDETDDAPELDDLVESLSRRALDALRRDLLELGLTTEDSGSDLSNGLSHADIGLQMTLSDSEIGIAVPYWHPGPEATRAMGVVSEIAAICRRHGLRIWDPQMGSEFDARALARMAGTMSTTTDRLHALASTRPWWRFWRR